MSDQDIVTRLRGHIAITTRLHYAKDGYPEPVYVHGPSPICQEAADEIERLRKERDEARRMVCELDADIMEDRLEYARHRGWDCYPELKEKP
jgi:hypothetical protein